VPRRSNPLTYSRAMEIARPANIHSPRERQAKTWSGLTKATQARHPHFFGTILKRRIVMLLPRIKSPANLTTTSLTIIMNSDRLNPCGGDLSPQHGRHVHRATDTGAMRKRPWLMDPTDDLCRGDAQGRRVHLTGMYEGGRMKPLIHIL
jgi:hypothetical protein